MIVFLIIALSCLFNSNTILGQEREPVSDFYEYANRDWIKNTSIPENVSVVNNWGILWNKIIKKSIEILSSESNYDLDGDNQYILTQLRNFYKSTYEYSDNERKRVYLVQKHYPLLFGVIFSKITIPKRKEEKIKELIEYLSFAYKEKVENSIKIKENAKDFFMSILDEMQFEIGAPDISSLPIMPLLSLDSLSKNIQKSDEYQLKIKPYKPNWESPPYETDCRYNSSDNVVKIYAGTIYDTGFTNEDDFPMIFARLGRTVAHEMTHAFDMHGNKFKRNDWKQITEALIDQFNKYSVLEEFFVDGKKTLQENFADLGGVEVSLLALKHFLNESFPHYSKEEEFTAIKSYFISYAQFWKEKATAEFEISSLKRIHTPQKFRAIGPIYNQNEFYEVYEIDTNSKYYIPENLRICIW
ncbi:M13-type metalloendopeptidase [Bacteroidota bacterium]